MNAIQEGDKFTAHVPIQLSEDQSWEPGTVVEVVSVSVETHPGFGVAVELEAPDGSQGSFAQIDLEGDHAWFHRTE